MKCFAFGILRSVVAEKKYDIVMEYANKHTSNDKSIIIQEYAGSDIRVFTRGNDINVLCPKDMSVTQENALTKAIANGTIFDDAETVDNTAKYISLTKLPHRGIANRGIEQPKKINFVISLVIGKMNDDGRCCVDDADIKNGCNCVDDMMKYDEKKTTVPDIVNDYIENKERYSLDKDTLRDIGYVQKEIDDIADVTPEDSINDDDYEYLDMNKDVTEQRYNSEDDTVQEGFLDRIKDWFNRKRQEGMDRLQPPKKETTPPEPPKCPEYDITKTVLEKIKKDTLIDYIHIDTTVVPYDSVKPTDSFIGGKPAYAERIPSKNGQALRFLAQINCSELPELKGYPSKGLLQFWITRNICDDDDCEVVYYSNPTNNTIDQLDIDTEMYDKEDQEWPIIDGSVGKMTFKKSQDSMSVEDYRFNDLFVNAYNEIAKQTEGVEEISAFHKIRKDVWDYIWKHTDLLSGGYGDKIGGYPHFCQYDPRESEKSEELLLLQIDSDGDFIQWGDCGTANFFIKEQDLMKYKFDNCMFHWDCY